MINEILSYAHRNTPAPSERLYLEEYTGMLVKAQLRDRICENDNDNDRNGQSNLRVIQITCDVFDSFASKGTSRRNFLDFVIPLPVHDCRDTLEVTKLETELDWWARPNFDTSIKLIAPKYIDTETFGRPPCDKIYCGEWLWQIPAQGDS